VVSHRDGPLSSFTQRRQQNPPSSFGTFAFFAQRITASNAS
jgi:hypothetical protein